MINNNKANRIVILVLMAIASVLPVLGKGVSGNVIYVCADAKGSGTGANWNDAVTNFYQATAMLSADKNEIWLAGNIDLSVAPSAIAPTVAATIRGGFAGTEKSPADRAKNARSTLNGGYRYNPFVINNAHALTIDGFAIVRANGAGLKKTGAGDITLENCDIVECGHFQRVLSGYGAAISGAADTTTATLRNCVIAGNGLPHASLGLSKKGFNDSGRGMGVFFSKLKRAVIADCYFVTNGVPFTQTQRFSVGWRKMSGSAIFAESAPLTVIGTRFVANRCHVNNIADTGSTIVLAGGTGGSAFTNCFWVGNQNANMSITKTVNGGGGEVRIMAAKTTDTYDFYDCTFAANLEKINTLSGGAINARKGTVNIRKCVFAANTAVGSPATGAKDVAMTTNAVVNVSHSIFESPKCLYCPPGGTMNIGEGVIFGEAKLGTPTTPLRFMIKYGQFGAPYYPYDSLSFFTGFDARVTQLGSAGQFTKDSVVTDVKRPEWNKMLLCDQSVSAARICDGTNEVWRWKGSEDKAIAGAYRSRFGNGVADFKVLDGGTKFLMTCNGGWVIVDAATTNAVAYGFAGGWPHSAEMMPGDIMSVTSTQTLDPSQRGLYLCYYGGGKEKSPREQKRYRYPMDNPHGAYWCPNEKRLYVSDTPGLHRLKIDFDGNTFKVEEDGFWPIAPLGLTYGHDLMKVPGRDILSMTTHEKVIFFDLNKKEWINEMALFVPDAKGFDVAPDGKTYLLTVANHLFNPPWTTDTLHYYTEETGYRVFHRIIGGKFYKARWFPYELKLNK